MKIQFHCSEERSIKLNYDIEYVIDKYSSMVYKISILSVRSKHDAEDIFQEVFLKYMNADKKFKDEEHRKAWLIRVTVNCCKSHMSSSWMKKTVSYDDYDESTTINMTEEEIDLFNAMKNLPQKLMTVILLFYYEDMSIKEISNVLEISEANVKMRLSRARKELKEILHDDYLFGGGILGQK